MRLGRGEFALFVLGKVGLLGGGRGRGDTIHATKTTLFPCKIEFAQIVLVIIVYWPLFSGVCSRPQFSKFDSCSKLASQMAFLLHRRFYAGASGCEGNPRKSAGIRMQLMRKRINTLNA